MPDLLLALISPVCNKKTVSEMHIVSVICSGGTRGGTSGGTRDSTRGGTATPPATPEM